MGLFIGAALGMFVLYSLWEYLVFRRIFDDPLKGKMAALVAAYLTAGTLSGIGMADGGPFNFSGFILYLFGAIPVGIYAIHRGLKLRQQPEPEPEAKVFD